MMRRHFLMNQNKETGSVIKYTTSDGSIFDMQGILDYWASLNTEILLGASVTSNTYSDVGLIVLNTIIDRTGYFGDSQMLFPIFTTSIFSSDIDMTKLTSVELPDTITYIGDLTFLVCAGLLSVTLPKQVESIGGSAFLLCVSLTSITIPNSVTSIGSRAFQDCSSLTSVTIPESVTSIGDDAFEGCSAIDTIVWNAKNYDDASSSESPFYAIRSQITSFTFGEAVEHIPAYLCEGMDKLASITIPNSVISIGECAFSYCTSFTSVTIPNSVTSIGDDAFYGCSSLPIENNLRYADTYLVEAVDKTLSTYSINDGTKWIGSRAFSGCSSLTSITIPNSVTSIGERAFENCSSLTSVTIGNSVTSIGGSAFDECYALTSVTIPNSVTSIGYCAFVDSYEKEIFFLGTIEDWCKLSLQNGLGGYYLYLNDVKAEDIVIPNTISTINNYLFKGCDSLTSVTIPEGVTSIGEEAFCSCSSLSSITIPLSVVSIGLHGFSYSDKLNSINFNGTSNLWQLITKGNYWNNGIPATVVHCTDGDVTL